MTFATRRPAAGKTAFRTALARDGVPRRGPTSPHVAESLERRLTLSAATHLTFAQSVPGTTTGAALAFVAVDVDDASDAVVTSDVSQVTITLSTGAFSTGSNTATASALSGVATFSQLAIDAPGTYTLTASDGSLASATSDTFTVYYFNSSSSGLGYPSGAFLQSNVVRDASGDLFGTTYNGGAAGYGSVFEVVNGTPSVITLASFNNTNGANPESGAILDSSGDLFGTTTIGGASNDGTVFEIAKGTTSLTTIAGFNNTDGADPIGGLTLDSNGNLFGTAESGGPLGAGTVFEIAKGSSSIILLAEFGSTSGPTFDGSGPVAGVTLDSGGDLFGTTHGYPGVNGTAFEIASGTHSITTIATFYNPSGPAAGVTLDSSGNLFGTTPDGGDYGDGTVYEIACGTTSITNLASFDGANPNAGLTLDSDADLFGTTYNSGADGFGTVFEVARGTTSITTLSSFNNVNGEDPYAGVILDSSDDLLGTTENGGAVGEGTVYELAQGSASITTLASFINPNADGPDAGVALDSSGDLFGTTLYGGDNDQGSVYEMPRGTTSITALADFSSVGGLIGALPESGVILDSSGDLFGTTYSGGTDNDGDVFEVRSGTTYTYTLANFNSGDGANPRAGLAIDSDGDLFGTTCNGGTAGDGTVFEIAAGTTSITTLAVFTGANGANPDAGLVLDSSGDLFGTTPQGAGTIFEIAYGTDSITTLASFDETNGDGPDATMTIDSSGDLFGTTSGGGASGDGAVYEVARGSNSIATVASFSLANGFDPQGGVALDSIGDLFGTTNGGASNFGTVFEIAHGSPSVTTLFTFNGTDGAFPNGVTLDSSGDLLGATGGGGPTDDGTIFELAASEQLTFTQPPNGATAGAVINGSTGVQVAVGDPEGRPFAGNTDTVTLSLGGGSSATATAINGVATFTGLDVGTPGSYSLTASDGSLTARVPAFNVDFLNSMSSGLEYPNAAFPESNVVFDSAGDLFGTTTHGGADAFGTVYEIAQGTTSITTLASFNGANGAYPLAGVTLDSSGDLLGTAYSGGASGDGTIFEIAHGTTSITTLVSFNSSDGMDISSGITLDSSGDLFGATEYGGSNDCGTVFELPYDSSSLTTLANFNITGGNIPGGGVTLDSSGNIFGTTAGGGTFGDGTVFEIAQGTTAITTLACFNDTDGANPTATVNLDSTGDLFGTTYTGVGSDFYGTVFEIGHGTSSITTLASFNNTDGANPLAAMALDSSGDLFGTTKGGGSYGDLNGTVFEIAYGTGSINTLAAFVNNGAVPLNGVTLDSSGDLFGTTFVGGTNNDGTVFEIAHGTRSITTIASFINTDSVYPFASVTLDSEGNVYGTTSGGGVYSAGTVFEISRGTTAITTLASFNTTDGYDPLAGVTLDSSGDLFGTTAYGGAGGLGTIFEIAHGTNSITTLATFNSETGVYPEAGITIDSSGDLFGTTTQAGETNSNEFETTQGTVFEIARGTASITTLLGFNSIDGADPPAGVTLDSSGDLFGTTYQGGIGGDGTVFELGAAEQLTFTQPPTATAGGAAINGSTGVQVTIGDSQGRPIAGNADTVTLTLSSGTFTNGGNTATATAADGVATFPSLAIDTPGSYTLTAGDGSLTAVPSATFTIWTPALPSWISALSGATWNAGTSTLTVTGPTTITSDPGSAEPNIVASGTNAQLTIAPTAPDQDIHVGGITLTNGAGITMQSVGAARSHNNHNVLVVGTLGATTDPTFSIDSLSKLDLQDNDLVIHTGSNDTAGKSELASVQALAAMGRAVPPGGNLFSSRIDAWSGNGLMSSTAAAADALTGPNGGYELNVLGVVDNSDLSLGSYRKWIVGSAVETLGKNDILVKYTYNGDFSLEGEVGADAATVFSGAYAPGVPQNDFAFGDTNGDGFVDGVDATAFSGELYGLGTAFAQAGEPATQL